MRGREYSGVSIDARDEWVGPGLSHPTPHAAREAVALPSFRRLLQLKRVTIIPMMIVSMVFFLGVTLLFGYQRAWMGTPVGGGLNLGYILILGVYALCWVIALLYFAVATYWFDPRAARAVAENDGEGGPS